MPTMESPALRMLSTFLAALMLAACAENPPTKVQAPPPWPADSWESATPESQGLDSNKLEALHQEFLRGDHGYVDGMLVIRNGYLVFERSYEHDYVALFPDNQEPGQYNYLDPNWHPYYQSTDLHSMQSVSKSVTATLFGVALQRGEIESLTEPASPFFSAFTIRDDGLGQTALTDLLTMRSGIEWDESSVAYTDPANSCALMEASENWVQFVLDRPLVDEPGTKFVYNSGVTVLLAQILKESTGQHAHEYAEEHLFKPLGITDHYWKITPTGVTDAEGGLYLKPTDLARIGYLYLNDGVWDGVRLLPEGFAEEATRMHVEFQGERAPGTGYGYQWWVAPHPRAAGESVFAGRGYGGQLLLVVPQEQLIGVFTGWNVYDQPSLPWLFALERLVDAAG